MCRNLEWICSCMRPPAPAPWNDNVYELAREWARKYDVSLGCLYCAIDGLYKRMLFLPQESVGAGVARPHERDRQEGRNDEMCLSQELDESGPTGMRMLCPKQCKCAADEEADEVVEISGAELQRYEERSREIHEELCKFVLDCNNPNPPRRIADYFDPLDCTGLPETTLKEIDESKNNFGLRLKAGSSNLPLHVVPRLARRRSAPLPAAVIPTLPVLGAFSLRNLSSPSIFYGLASKTFKTTIPRLLPDRRKIVDATDQSISDAWREHFRLHCNCRPLSGWNALHELPNGRNCLLGRLAGDCGHPEPEPAPAIRGRWAGMSQEDWALIRLEGQARLQNLLSGKIDDTSSLPGAPVPVVGDTHASSRSRRSSAVLTPGLTGDVDDNSNSVLESLLPVASSLDAVSEPSSSSREFTLASNKASRGSSTDSVTSTAASSAGSTAFARSVSTVSTSTTASTSTAATSSSTSSTLRIRIPAPSKRMKGDAAKKLDCIVECSDEEDDDTPFESEPPRPSARIAPLECVGEEKQEKRMLKRTNRRYSDDDSEREEKWAEKRRRVD
ncbi:uncharacterized protein STEHIDRAFT_115749 [Stereum hirsutum FP-91666 SS1]|uniref:Uncharacterized protein n=1 Tax=Stereum hirsutum (strain FP-91666) TaxID=721885 RepID=R7S138_STEHR|nr:uncharacterized protein STEHIDRAFT_115749 [Stereum hirsutum FP-91666 SS1]EIM80272.1 hypothetical protein STEHIDRAFT_115749 [Stereum hirsutum FP-91666 SS1]